MLLKYGKIQIDTQTGKCTCENERVALTRLEEDLLIAFIQHRNEVLSRDWLLHNIWGIDPQIKTRTVDVHVMHLRRKLDLSHQLVTVSRRGYQLL